MTAFLLILSVNGRVGLAAESADGVQLPRDGDAVVLEMAYQDAARRAPETVVAVHADGTVVVSAAGGAGELQGRLTHTQLSSLIHEIVEDAAVFELDSDRIQEHVREAAERSGKPWRVDNPGSVLVRVRLRDRQHEIRCPAAEIWHERFPHIESLAQLCAVRRRLENVRAVVQVGGREQADKLAKLANAELLRAYPAATPVTAADLSMVRGHFPEPRFVQFVSPSSTRQGETLLISIFEFPDQPVRVTITPISAASAR